MSTPYITNGDVTPKEEINPIDNDTSQYAGVIFEKTRERVSFTEARVAKQPSRKASSSTGLTKEHTEQGRVKLNVYKQYIEAASKTGFIFFLLLTVLQQAASVAANLTLRDWGEHNREVGANRGMMKYLIIYGSFSLSSTLLSGLSSILIWVYCGLRSARRLHDGV